MSSQIRPRALLLSLLLAVTAVPAGALWREFALASDRSDDQLLLEVLESVTFDERIGIMAGLGERSDPFIGAYIEAFLVHRSSRPVEAEHLLRVLLESAFPRAEAPERIAGRVGVNRDALLAAAGRLESFDDPQLAAAVVRLIPWLDGGRAGLAGTVERLVAKLERGDGLLDPREDGLLLDALEAMGRIGSPDFLEPALAVARLSREKPVVDRAREVARGLAGRPAAASGLALPPAGR